MPFVKFHKTLDGSSANPAGNAAGSEAWLSEAEAERLLITDPDAIEILANDPVPGTSPARTDDDIPE